MALITCPRCGRRISDRAEKCPTCGISKEEILRLIEEQTAREAAEQERLRKEREAKEAEDARIKAERRAEWWRTNSKNVWTAIGVLMGIIFVLIICAKINRAKEAKLIAQNIDQVLAAGDSCMHICAFDKAEKFYRKALDYNNDQDTYNRVRQKLIELNEQHKQADEKFNRALEQLQILLKEDDDVFNQNSYACLEEMKQIYPNRVMTTHYQNLAINQEKGITAMKQAPTPTKQAEHEPQATPERKAKGQGSNIYDLVVGSYTDDAKEPLREIRAKGYREAFLVAIVDDNGCPRNRVIAKRVYSKEEARKVQKALTNQGIKSWVWRH